MVNATLEDAGVSIWIGTHRMDLDPAASTELAGFLDADVVDRVWASDVPLVHGGLEFVRGDGTHVAQHARDLRRRRVVVRHGGSNWHLLREELVALGDRLRALHG